MSHFCAPGSTDQIESRSNPDPGSATLVKTKFFPPVRQKYELQAIRNLLHTSVESGTLTHVNKLSVKINFSFVFIDFLEGKRLYDVSRANGNSHAGGHKEMSSILDDL